MRGQMSLVFLLAIIFTLHAGAKNWACEQESAQSQEREAAIDEARRLSIEVVALINRGDYDLAMSKALRVLEIRERVFGLDDPNVASPLTNIAYIFYKKNNYSKARELYERAVAIIEKHKIESQDAASTLSNFALLFHSEGDLVNAERLYRRALAVLEKTPQNLENPVTAVIMINLANVLYANGDSEGARTLFERALTVQEKNLGPETPELISTLNSLAFVYQSRNDFNKAEATYQRALAMLERSGITTQPLLATVLRNLSSLNDAKGDIARSVDFARRAGEIEERNLRVSLASGAADTNYSYWTLQLATMMDVSLHVHDAPNDKAAARVALTTVLRRKGRVLDTMVYSIRALRGRSSLADRDLLNKLSAVRSQLAALIAAGSDQPGAANNSAFEVKLQDYRRLEERINASRAEFRPPSDPVTIESIQKLIPKNAAVIEFVCYNPFNAKARKKEEQWGPRHYAGYVLHHNGDIAWADLGEAQSIDYAIWNLGIALRNPSNNPEGQNVQALARALYDKLEAPFRKLSITTRRLFISPDSMLQLIPFEALIDKRGHYLIERYSFTYLSTARDLIRLQLLFPSREPPLIVANPDFSTRRTKTSPPDSACASPEKISATRTVYMPLTGTEEEAQEIKRLFPNARILKGVEATEAALKQIHGPSILHIATHAFVTKTQVSSSTNLDITEVNGEEIFKPAVVLLGLEANRSKNTEESIYSLSRSGLVLAGANNNVNEDCDDGILTAFEVSGLDLAGTKMVVLSACETGRADVESGNGVDGLRRSLMLAGAESQVISLWKVNDETTRDIMIDLYTKLRAGTERTKAMREIKLDMLRSRDYRHPYFWASFLQSGDWRSIYTKSNEVRPHSASTRRTSVTSILPG